MEAKTTEQLAAEYAGKKGFGRRWNILPTAIKLLQHLK